MAQQPAEPEEEDSWFSRAANAMFAPSQAV